MDKNVEIGIGIDLEKIHRFDNLNLRKDSNFLNKIFTKKELDYCYSKDNPSQHLAARFAAKEAFIKAAQSAGEDTLLEYSSIKIDNNSNGEPFVTINKNILKFRKIKLTLTHCKDVAGAFVLIIK